MLNTQELIDLGLARDRQELTRRVEAVVGSLGFGLFQAVWVRGRFGSPGCELVACGNPPDGYYESATSVDDSVRDPFLSRLLAAPGFQRYDHRLYVEHGARDLYDLQEAYGYKQGVGLSLQHATHADAFLFGVDGPDDLPRDPVADMRLQSALMLLTVHVQAAVQRLARPEHQAECLSRQELAAVRAVAPEVYRQAGRLVAIESRPGLAGAARKLGATTAAGVVLRAIDGGFIQP